MTILPIFIANMIRLTRYVPGRVHARRWAPLARVKRARRAATRLDRVVAIKTLRVRRRAARIRELL